MRRRAFITALGGAALALPFTAQAQQPQKLPRIGVLSPAVSFEASVTTSALRDGFKDVGYVNGNNVIFEYRFFGEDLEKADLLAKQLVELKCDVLVGVTATSALALRKATSTLPIVFVLNSNPVGSGLVASLNHPGGNVTGITHVTADLAAKRVELLKETVPGLSSVALIWDTNPAIQFINRREIEDTRIAANQLGLSFEAFECGSPEVVEAALSKASQFGAAILGNSNWYSYSTERKRFAEQAIARRLPVIGGTEVFAEAGLLMSYGSNWQAIARAAAPLVKKILEGEKPGDIPVQQPTVFDLVYNLKTAQALGIQIPPIMLARATRVIE